MATQEVSSCSLAELKGLIKGACIYSEHQKQAMITALLAAMVALEGPDYTDPATLKAASNELALWSNDMELSAMLVVMMAMMAELMGVDLAPQSWQEELREFTKSACLMNEHQQKAAQVFLWCKLLTVMREQ